VAIKKKRNQEDTRSKLLKAALDVFSKDGYDAATTRNIAKKACVNESLIHRYFKSKLGLFFALKQQFRENFIKEFLSYEASESLEEELVRFMKSKLHASKREKKFFKLAISRAMLDMKLRDDVRSLANLRPPALFERFENFRKKGLIRENVNLDEFVSVLHTFTFGFSILHDAIECLTPADAESLIRSAAEILVKGLIPRKP
jgi:AcrR family transcriptional regulator